MVAGVSANIELVRARSKFQVHSLTSRYCCTDPGACAIKYGCGVVARATTNR